MGLILSTTDLDNTVGNMRLILLTRRIIIPYSGGSSKVLSRAFWAASVILSAIAII